MSQKVNAAAPTARPEPDSDIADSVDPQVQPEAHGQPDAKAKAKQDKAALNAMLSPVKSRLLIGRVLGACSGIVSIAPYVALVALGAELLSGNADPDRVQTIVFALLTGFLLQALFLMVGLAVTHFADLKLGRLLRERIIKRIAHAPLSWFSDATSGRVRKAVQDDVKTLHTLIAHAPVEEMVAVVTPLALAVYSFIIDWRLGLLAFVSVPVYLAVQGLYMRGMAAKTAEMDTRLGDVSSAVVEFSDGIAVVKAFGRFGQAHRRYVDAADGFGRFYLGWVGPMLKGSSVAEAFISVPVLVLLNVGVGSLVVQSGSVSVADVITTTMIALILPNSIETIGNTQWSYQLAGAAATRLTDLLHTEELDVIADVRGEESEPADETGVVFEDVSFTYGTEGADALKDVSLRLDPCTVTALTGPSGSGKSTLALMLARFYDPTHGRIMIGGRDIRSMEPGELYGLVAFVLQDSQLVRDTLRENVRLGVPDASDEQIWQALEHAYVADEIRELPNGLDTVFGEGIDLSGGQMQRIAIARALLMDTPILIMDEAMSAADPGSEAEIQRALSHLVEGRTVLVIAHRPESVFGAQQILRLDGGRIAERIQGEAVTDDAVRKMMHVRNDR